MARTPLNDLAAFAVVAQERSFTRAAKQLNVSPSALSHVMRGLEERLGVRLLARTTRSVLPTEAGERLLMTLGPALAEIEASMAALHDSRDAPAGTVRITAVKHAVDTLLMPMLPGFAEKFPGIRLAIDVDDGFVDIVAGGYDVGIRFSGAVEKDMIAVNIGPELSTILVAAPAYLAGNTKPSQPRDLADHRCIIHRQAEGGVYAWPLQIEGRIEQVRCEAALAFNDSGLVLEAALAGQGIACVFADLAKPHLTDGSLVPLMSEASVRFPGYALYYAGRRQLPTALARFIETLREQCRVRSA